LAGFNVEGVEGAPAPVAPETHAAPEWTAIEEARYLQEGALIRSVVLGVALILCKAAGQLYAYRDRCPACNLPLHLGTLEAGVLACRAGHRFSVRNAGVSPDDAHLHLEPVPLVLKEGMVEVALASEAALAKSNGS
jgi:nitrite reductase/ring-hydroxylating ferredoxin subunit